MQVYEVQPVAAATASPKEAVIGSAAINVDAVPPSPMRQPKPAARLQSAGTDTGGAGVAAVLPSLSTIAFARMGYGARPGDLEAYEKLGATETARFEAYVDQQLHPDQIDDAELEARLVAGGFTTLKKTFDQLWLDHHLGPPGGPVPDSPKQLEPFWETESATFLRAMYSRRQLFEVLVDFWHNHFNVYGPEYWAAPVWVSYDRDVIRANALGNFRTFLESVGTSFPMMLFLDGWGNSVSGPNENYARELFELHGLGAENYFGVRRQEEVPKDTAGRPAGYVDDDVYESTRAFTGWGIDFNTGKFQYFPERHDRFQKYVLGKFLRSDQAPLKDGRDVYDLVAAHPGTARFVARKLCRRLIADDPPQRIVTEAAEVFLAQKDAPDQIRQVVRTILLSPEFRTTFGQKVKRPLEFTVGCFRAVNGEMHFKLFDRTTDYFIALYSQAGQPLFRWQTPDGYPETHEKWIGSNAFVGRWRIANWINVVRHWWDFSVVPFDPVAQIPAGVKSSAQVADFWINRILGRPMSTKARQEVVEFMARGRDPELAWQGFGTDALRERLYGTIALIMTSPDNLLH